MPSVYPNLRQSLFSKHSSRARNPSKSSLITIEKWKSSLKDFFTSPKKFEAKNTSTSSLISRSKTTKMQPQSPKTIAVEDAEALKALGTLYEALHDPSILDARRHHRYDLYPPADAAVSSITQITLVSSIVESPQMQTAALPLIDGIMTQDAATAPTFSAPGRCMVKNTRSKSSDSDIDIRNASFSVIAHNSDAKAINIISPSWRTSTFDLTPPQGFATTSLDATRVLDAADMKVIRFLGEGTTGKVYYVKDLVSKAKIALKVIPKEGKSKYTLGVLLEERDISEKLSDSPWFVNLYCSWHDHDYLYIAMTAYPTDLDSELIRYEKLEPSRARFYMAELIIALTELHSRGIIHRDIKAANILIDREGHIVLADFGLSKDFYQIPSIAERVYQPYWPYLPHDNPSSVTRPRDADELHFVAWDYRGSELEMAPEVHLRKPYSFGVDFWSAAVVLYWMVTGRPPWYEEEDDYEDDDDEDIKPLPLKIAEDDLYWDPADDVDDDTKDFLERMLMKDPKRRLMISYDMPNHPYFAGVNWSLMEARKLPAPWIPDMEIYHAYEQTSPTFAPAEPYSVDDFDPYPEFTYLSEQAQQRVVDIAQDSDSSDSSEDSDYDDVFGTILDARHVSRPYDQDMRGDSTLFDSLEIRNISCDDTDHDSLTLRMDSLCGKSRHLKEVWDMTIVSPPSTSPYGPGPKGWLQPQDLLKIYAKDTSTVGSLATCASDSVVEVIYCTSTESNFDVDPGECTLNDSYPRSHQSPYDTSLLPSPTPVINGNGLFIKVKMLMSKILRPRSKKERRLRRLALLPQ